MGESEKDIISKLKGVTDRIIELEKQARESLMKDSREALEDRLWRSYGTLKYARIMSSDEAKQLMSDVILGINMGIIESDADIMELMTKSEPGQLIKAAGRSLDATERDTARAAMIREKI
jgi:protein arginine kinase